MATTKKKNIFKRIADWYRGMKSELKKVVWPSAKQIINNSLVVLVVVLVCAVVVGGFDFIADRFVELLTNIFA